MKTHIEGEEPIRLPDNTSTAHQKKMKKVIRGLFGYSSHSNPESKHFSSSTFAPGNLEAFMEARKYVSGVKDLSKGWYAKRSAHVPIPISR